MRALVWFRSDLRVRDHLALDEARRATDDLEALFILTPDQWRAHDWGDARVSFLMRTLRAHASMLEDRGIRFHVREVPTFDDVPGVVCDLVESRSIDVIHANREVEWNEQRRDGAVLEALPTGCDLRLHDDDVLLAPPEVRTTSGDHYSVFTPFSKRVASFLKEACPDVRPMVRKTGASVKKASIPTSIEGYDLEATDPDRWPAGEDEGIRALKSFMNRIDDYAKARDRFQEDGTSRLSPHLAVGSLSIRQCLHGALDAGGSLDLGDGGADVWIKELLWREFYRHLIVAVPRLSRGRQMKAIEVPWRDDAEGLRAWKEGRTGVPIVDAAMRQLLETSWMHNRLRMVVAMFLTKNLLIDWREGERFFMEHLIDGDLANNNGGWQWAASTGADAAPYFRVFNPVSQGLRYDKAGSFIRRFCPELKDADDPHDPSKGDRASCGYPEAIVDLKASRTRAIEAFRAADRPSTT